MVQGKNKKIIGFDLDGVIIDHTESKLELAKQLGFSLTPEQTPSDVMKTILPHDLWRNLQHSLYNTEVVLGSASLMPGVLQVFEKMRDQNIPYALISRRHIPEQAINFLVQNSLWPGFLNAENTFFVPSKEDKNRKAAELGVTHYIDDELSVLEVLESVPHKFLFDHLNAFQQSNRFPRITSWDILLESLE